MKKLSIRHQFGLILIAFSLAMPAAVGTLVWVMGGSLSETRKAAAENSRRGAALFALIGTLDQVQGGTLQLIREKDPDKIRAFIRAARLVEAELFSPHLQLGEASIVRSGK